MTYFQIGRPQHTVIYLVSLRLAVYAPQTSRVFDLFPPQISRVMRCDAYSFDQNNGITRVRPLTVQAPSLRGPDRYNSLSSVYMACMSYILRTYLPWLAIGCAIVSLECLESGPLFKSTLTEWEGINVTRVYSRNNYVPFSSLECCERMWSWLRWCRWWC